MLTTKNNRKIFYFDILWFLLSRVLFDIVAIAHVMILRRGAMRPTCLISDLTIAS
jgi:hypothetical protein